MTVETTDPMVALLYGLLCYPSQRPAVTTTTDLVVGHPGPWGLDNDDQAQIAVGLVARFRAGTSTADPLAEAVAATVLDAVQSCRVMVTEFWSANNDHLPKAMEHEVVQLEERLLRFTAALQNLAPHAPVEAPAAAPGALPSIDVAAGLRADEWIVLIRDRGLDQATVVRTLRSDAEADGRTPPGGLRDVQGRPDLAALLLAILDTAPVTA